MMRQRASLQFFRVRPTSFSRPAALLVLSLVCLARPSRCAAPSEPIHVSDRAAAMTNSGVRETVVGGSVQNPAHLHLASVQDMAAMQADLSELDRLLKELGMTFTLEQSRDMTMFMPVDKAFQQLPFNIHELSWQAKWRIVQYHIIPHDVIDLDSELKGKEEVEFETWEGGALKMTKAAAEGGGDGSSESSSSSSDSSSSTSSSDKSSSSSTDGVRYFVNGDAQVVSQPPRIETFNGASYKINKVLIPPSMTEEDFAPAHSSDRLNPEIEQQQQQQQQRLRRRPDGTPSAAEEQRLASVTGTVDMQRSTHDPRLPGSFRPDPLLLRSQNTPDFLINMNSAHSRWDDAVYHRTPKARGSETTQPIDVTMGYQEAAEQETNSRIKVLNLANGAVIPATAQSSAMTRIGGSPATAAEAAAPRSSVGLTFESSENPEDAPEDSTSHFINVLLGGVAPRVSEPPSQAAAAAAAADARAAARSSGSSSSSRQQQRAEEPSLFSLGFHPTEAPKIQALGLAEGLLPSEELITHHWSPERQQQAKRPAAAAAPAAAEAGISGQAATYQYARPPISALWHQMQDRSRL